MTHVITSHPSLAPRTKMSITSATLLVGLFGALCGGVTFDHSEAAPSHVEEAHVVAQDDAPQEATQDVTPCPIAKTLFSDQHASAGHNPVAIALTVPVLTVDSPQRKYAQAYTPPAMVTPPVTSLTSDLPIPSVTVIPAPLPAPTPPPIPPLDSSQSDLFAASPPPASSAVEVVAPEVIVPEVAVALPVAVTSKKPARMEQVSLLGPLRVDGRLFTIETLDKIPAEPPIVPKEFTPPPTLPEHLATLKPLPPLTSRSSTPTAAALLPQTVRPVRQTVSTVPLTTERAITTKVPPAPHVAQKPPASASRSEQAAGSLVPLSQLARPAASPVNSDGFVPIRYLPLRSASDANKL